MIQEFFPSEWNGDTIRQFKRNQLSSGKFLNGANAQNNVVGVFAMLKPSFVASFADVIKPLGFRKGVSAISLNSCGSFGSLT